MKLNCSMATLIILLLFSSSVYGIESKEPKQDTVTITIINLRFYPEKITISKGTTVTWVNNDTRPHKVVPYDRLFYGPRMNPGDTYQFTFNNVGTHRYFDAVFTKIGRGEIIVKEDLLPVTDEPIEISSKEENKEITFGKAHNHPMIYLAFLQKESLMY